jgi:hypothetical protein
MRRLRAIFAWVDRYLLLSGRNCCAGRSWEGLERSLARRQTPNDC